MGEAVRLDILSSTLTVAGQMEFTSNIAVAQVAMLPPLANLIEMQDSNQVFFFEAGDSLLLDRLWVTIPHGFRAGTGLTRFEFLWKNALGTSYPVNSFPINNSIAVPDICDGIEFQNGGLYLPMPTGIGNAGLIIGPTFTNMNISMANVPTILNATLFKVQVHLMVRHTKTML